jgi:hypothetical protein
MSQKLGVQRQAWSTAASLEYSGKLLKRHFSTLAHRHVLAAKLGLPSHDLSSTVSRGYRILHAVRLELRDMRSS